MAVTARSTTYEQDVLHAARGGDEAAFSRLAEEHHAALLAHCYRMLGSLQDAEDALQETLLRAWRGLPGFDGRSTLRTWLYRIATNVCIDAIARRPAPDASGRVRPPSDPIARRRRAARRVDLAGSVPGAARWTATRRPRHATSSARRWSSRSSRRSSTCRPRSAPSSSCARCSASRPERCRRRWRRRSLRSTAPCNAPAGPSTSGCPSGASKRRCARSATIGLASWSRRTWTRGHEATSTRSATSWPRTPPSRCRRGRAGAAAARRSRASRRRPLTSARRARTVPTRANGQPAIAYYHLDDETGRYKAAALDVLTFDGSQIKDITAFVKPELFPRFGLPVELAP